MIRMCDDKLDSSQAFHDRVDNSNPDFKDEEEKYVITGGEQKQAEANGEVESGQKVREDHNGVFLSCK